MEYVAGGPVIRKGAPPLEEDVAKRCFCDIINGLEYCKFFIFYFPLFKEFLLNSSYFSTQSKNHSQRYKTRKSSSIR